MRVLSAEELPDGTPAFPLLQVTLLVTKVKGDTCFVFLTASMN